MKVLRWLTSGNCLAVCFICCVSVWVSADLGRYAGHVEARRLIHAEPQPATQEVIHLLERAEQLHTERLDAITKQR